MSSRANRQNTPADEVLNECIGSSPPSSFLMIAGAGAGKTTSLIKALSELLRTKGGRLALRRQQVACITYTEVAAREIWGDVGNHPLVHVSTIHSFLWSRIRSFQSDIQEWVTHRIEAKLFELRARSEAFGPRVASRTREANRREIERYQRQLDHIGSVRRFTYGSGSDYLNGVLGHDDVIRMVPELINARPLLRSLLAQQYPFLFVDESQDTSNDVVVALKAVAAESSSHFCLGFFGDPMQQIYPTGIGAIGEETGWTTIRKRENFRCSLPVLEVANAIRREGDGLQQIPAGPAAALGDVGQTVGSANVFVLPIDDYRDRRLAHIRAWAAARTGDQAWSPPEGDGGVKVLVVVHRMAANRLGFGELYAALNDKAPEKFKNGFLDGTAWPLRPFMTFVLPIAIAAKEGREFEVMQILRRESPLLSRERVSRAGVSAILELLHQTTDLLCRMLAPESRATVGDVFRHLKESSALALDSRILFYLSQASADEPQTTAPNPPTESERSSEEDNEELSKELRSMDAFLSCPATQLNGYIRYLRSESPFSTQQGVKGAEFERVLVILDDDEGTHVQFSYDKYFGVKPLSPTDLANIEDGKDSVLDRTRRLFYVCCTRALKDLVVVLFTSDPATAHRAILSRGLFPSGSVHLEASLR